MQECTMCSPSGETCQLIGVPSRGNTPCTSPDGSPISWSELLPSRVQGAEHTTCQCRGILGSWFWAPPPLAQWNLMLNPHNCACYHVCVPWQEVQLLASCISSQCTFNLMSVKGLKHLQHSPKVTGDYQPGLHLKKTPKNKIKWTLPPHHYLT